MHKIVKDLLVALLVLGAIYLTVCLLLYWQQEKLVFAPARLPEDYVFRFNGNFEERFFSAPDGVKLHALLFRADTTYESGRKLLFFLHGNAGAVNGWGDLAPYYTNLGYDFIVMDYRGYGKSGGEIRSEKQFYADVQLVYRQMAQEYPEEHIAVTGFSIGTAAAAMLAARHKPGILLLLAPYYSLEDMLGRIYPFVPSFLLKYKFRTYAFIEKSNAPVYIFHGNRDEVIPYESSVKLKKHLELPARHITLEGQDHNSIHQNRQYRDSLQRLLLPN
ncbi:alpha/beta hydrolase [Cesiribacter sp. SM1]|uniref:alpha/beta hydrolase n=1 Tax=Cesiribacter sp. SM1 TaxID=2861196 RepID=UPI001CD22F1C|nr:alpha/beta hydrolase [Cesiribacter sp. SM1]